MPVDNHAKRKMEELGRALVQAIKTSSGVGEAVREIRRQGFSLQLILSCEQNGGPGPQVEFATPVRRPSAERSEAAFQGPTSGTPERPGSEATAADRRQPVFRLHTHDVAFLKSLGIDATRPGRRRRGT